MTTTTQSPTQKQNQTQKTQNKVVRRAKSSVYKNAANHPKYSKIIESGAVSLRKLNRMTKADKWYKLKKHILAQNWVIYVAALRIQCFFKRLLQEARSQQTRCPISLEDFVDHPGEKKFRHKGVLFFAANLATYLVQGTFLNPVNRIPVNEDSVRALDQIVPEYKVMEAYKQREAVRKAEMERLSFIHYLEDETGAVVTRMIRAGSTPFYEFLDIMGFLMNEFEEAFTELTLVDRQRAIVTIKTLRDRITDELQPYESVVHRETILDFIDTFARPRRAPSRSLWTAPSVHVESNSGSSSGSSSGSGDSSSGSGSGGSSSGPQPFGSPAPRAGRPPQPTRPPPPYQPVSGQSMQIPGQHLGQNSGFIPLPGVPPIAAQGSPSFVPGFVPRFIPASMLPLIGPLAPLAPMGSLAPMGYLGSLGPPLRYFHRNDSVESISSYSSSEDSDSDCMDLEEGEIVLDGNAMDTENMDNTGNTGNTGNAGNAGAEEVVQAVAAPPDPPTPRLRRASRWDMAHPYPVCPGSSL